jgi:hypothetical protein
MIKYLEHLGEAGLKNADSRQFLCMRSENIR